MSLTPIAALGEFGLIHHLTRNIQPSNPNLAFGIGDDAAVIRINNGKLQLVSTDLLLEGVHFDLTYTPLKHLGYKAVAVNVSDICAMNGQAQYITLSMGLSSKFTVEAVEELFSGVLAACKHYGVELVGGDTSSSLQGLILNVAVWGEVEENRVCYRHTAKNHDLLCVSGDLGAAYLGLNLLEREKRIFKENPDFKPDFEGRDYLLQRQLKPEARIDVVTLLAEAGVVPTSMIDVSDGLASECLHLATRSGLGVRLYEEKLPISEQAWKQAGEFKLEPAICALNGGEDYELLFTINQKDYEAIAQIAEISVIGHMTDASEGYRLMTKGEQLIDLEAQGWQAFKAQS